MSRTSNLNAAVKAKVISLLLTTTLDQGKIAELCAVSDSSVSKIKDQIPPELFEAKLEQKQSLENEWAEIEKARRELEEKQNSLPGLVTEMMIEGLKGCTAIAKQVQDDEWREKQSASGLTELYDSISGTTVRLLGAAQKAHASREEASRSLGSGGGQHYQPQPDAASSNEDQPREPELVGPTEGSQAKSVSPASPVD